MATKTHKFTLEVLDNELPLHRTDFETHIGAKLDRAVHEAREAAFTWAVGLWETHIQDVNERTSAGEDIRHEGLRQPGTKGS
jgi:hypothetical protein